jgi:hypothetical protein
MSKLIYSPKNPYSEDINDLIIEDEIQKGKALPIGTVRRWNGQDFIKHPDGWVAVKNGKLTSGKKMEEVQSHANSKDHEEHAKKHRESSSTPKETKQQSQNEVSPAEKESLKEYQNGVHNSALGGYANLNGYLRNGKPKYGEFGEMDKKLADQVINNISSAIKKHPITEPTVVYRGLKIKKDEPETQVYANSKVGDIISDKAFTSASTSRDVGKKFSEKLNNSDTSVLIQIQLGPGDHALPMDDYHYHGKEKEMLLDKNVKFKVLNVQTKNGTKHITLQPISQTESKLNDLKQKYKDEGQKTSVKTVDKLIEKLSTEKTEQGRDIPKGHEKIKSMKVMPFKSFEEAKAFHNKLTDEVGGHSNFESWDKVKTNSIKMSDLSTTQDVVSEIDPKYDKGSSSAPLVVKKDGKLILINGNHRVETAYKNGSDSINVKVFNLD